VYNDGLCTNEVCLLPLLPAAPAHVLLQQLLQWDELQT
jgi:hypothetical protein